MVTNRQSTINHPSPAGYGAAGTLLRSPHLSLLIVESESASSGG